MGLTDVCEPRLAVTVKPGKWFGLVLGFIPVENKLKPNYLCAN